MKGLIRAAGNQLVRRRFNTQAELISALYASLVQYLEDQELIRTGPFDATFCRNATMDDLSQEKINQFLRHARRARGLPLPEESEPVDVLTI